jgi:medium-chain acyl-[acyl-carrier-protein] hydrolase
MQMMNDRMGTSSWLTRAARGAQARVRLFCFPYAGGSALTFRRWPELLSPEVEVCTVHLPGRAARMRETPFADLHRLVDALLPVLAEHLERPFALFGHSMGGVIAFELSRRLRHVYGVEPRHLFISGRRAPHLPDTLRPIYNLPEPEFKEELRRLNGTPAEIFEHPEMMTILLPLLRADISLSQTYRCESRPSLTCPLTVYGGLRDTHDDRAGLEAWREHTVGAFNLKMFDGDHFFINTAQPHILSALESALLSDESALPSE